MDHVFVDWEEKQNIIDRYLYAFENMNNAILLSGGEEITHAEVNGISLSDFLTNYVSKYNIEFVYKERRDEKREDVN